MLVNEIDQIYVSNCNLIIYFLTVGVPVIMSESVPVCKLDLYRQLNLPLPKFGNGGQNLKEVRP